MVVYQHALLVHADGTILHFADANAAHVLIVVDGADEHLGVGVRISLRSRNIVDDRLKERRHIHIRVVQIFLGKSALCGGVEERAVQLLVGRVQIHKQLQHLVHHFLGTGLRAVDLI